MAVKELQIIGFSTFQSVRDRFSSACAGLWSPILIPNITACEKIVFSMNGMRLRQRDLSQIVKRMAINLLRTTRALFGMRENALFTVFNFYCDTKTFLEKKRGIFGVANKQGSRGADAEWRGNPLRLRC